MLQLQPKVRVCAKERVLLIEEALEIVTAISGGYGIIEVDILERLTAENDIVHLLEKQGTPYAITTVSEEGYEKLGYGDCNSCVIAFAKAITQELPNLILKFNYF